MDFLEQQQMNNEPMNQSSLQKLISLKKDNIVREQKQLADLEKKLKELRTKESEKIQAIIFDNKKEKMRKLIQDEMEMLGKIPEEEMENSEIPAKLFQVKRADYDENDDNNQYNADDSTGITHIDEIVTLCGGKPRFGDMLDFTQYRHYSIMFVGKNGSIVSNKYATCISDDIEYGLQVSADICRYLKDPLKKYKDHPYVAAFELPYDNKIVQNYKNVPKNCLYTYLNDFYETGEWELYVTNKDCEEVLLEK